MPITKNTNSRKIQILSVLKWSRTPFHFKAGKGEYLYSFKLVLITEKNEKSPNLGSTGFPADYIKPNKLKLTLKLPDKLNWIVHTRIMSQKA